MAVINYPVSSSALVRIDYDDETEECFITFKDGKNYVLQGVPQIEIERWTSSGSVGGYWNNFMRGRY